jgi:hypothetical protein
MLPALAACAEGLEYNSAAVSRFITAAARLVNQINADKPILSLVIRTERTPANPLYRTPQGRVVYIRPHKRGFNTARVPSVLLCQNFGVELPLQNRKEFADRKFAFRGAAPRRQMCQHIFATLTP